MNYGFVEPDTGDFVPLIPNLIERMEVRAFVEPRNTQGVLDINQFINDYEMGNVNANPTEPELNIYERMISDLRGSNTQQLLLDFLENYEDDIAELNEPTDRNQENVAPPNQNV